jgi:membrane glycosyltransferase
MERGFRPLLYYMDDVQRIKGGFRIDQIPADLVSTRKSLFLATGAGILAVGTWLMHDLLRSGGMFPLEWVLLVLFVPLFATISFGFAIAFWGFVRTVGGGDRYEVMNALPGAEEGPLPPVAIAVPIFNEPVERVFKGVENMLDSLRATGKSETFHLYILSDSSDLNHWLDEEKAWADLCWRKSAFGKVFYRKRRVSLHGKSGNIADFCRRWGRRYKYLVIMDADSVMTGQTLVRLARLMESSSNLGIVQTAPRMVLGTTAFQRMLQFSTRMVGPIFAAGSNFWHMAGGNYWGHNAIIRLKPFMEHCVLPELPTDNPKDRHIMSHDTVEAALMQKAGYQVWLAYLEEGSYEESPPNLSQSLKRDRRWCQGNLQHFWFLFAPAIPLTNRIHIFFGLMAYLSSPVWMAALVLSVIVYHEQTEYLRLSGAIESAGWAGTEGVPAALAGMTIVLLFAPKLLGFLAAARKYASFGGFGRAALSMVCETLASIVAAPIQLWFYTKFVILILLGMKVEWKNQIRSDTEVTFREAVREYWQPTLAGAASLGLLSYKVPELVPWLLPVIGGWILSIPYVMWTGSARMGEWLRRKGMFITPEEINPPPELKGLQESTEGFSESPGLHRVLTNPYDNAVHRSLLQLRSSQPRMAREYLDGLIERAVGQGPGALSPAEWKKLLWDAQSVKRLHERIWAEESVHPAWGILC